MTITVPDVSLTLIPQPKEAVADFFGRLARMLEERHTGILHMTLFGSVTASSAAVDAMRQSFGSIEWPITWVDGAGCYGHPIAGVQVITLAGPFQRIRLHGRVVGTIFEDHAARHCLLGGLRPVKPGAPPADQTSETLDMAVEALDQAGFTFADTVRTWFFMDDMLAWYPDFNKVRTAFYSNVKFRTGSLPASTGIGGSNPAKTALVASLWAACPFKATKIQEVASPLQCPAPAYGSSFSRAMEVASPQGRRLTISGTASIAPEGQTLWVDDTKRQVALTMEVVEAILKSRNYSFSDVTRATAYFRNAGDANIFAEWRSAHGWLSTEVVATNCFVCRDDLLFELELDAANPKV